MPILSKFLRKVELWKFVYNWLQLAKILSKL